MAHITIIGRAGGHPEIKALPGGKTVLEFSVAESNGKDADPTWYRISVWSDWLRERCSKHVHKGVRVTVCGRLKVRPYMNSAGIQAVSHDVSADLVEPHTWQDDQVPLGTSTATGSPVVTDSDIPF